MKGRLMDRKKKSWRKKSTVGIAQFIFRKNLTRATNRFGKSRYPTGRMIWQHVLILESICETNSIRGLFPAERMELFTPLLTCSPFFFFSILIGQFILNPTPFLPFPLLDKFILNPNTFSPFSLYLNKLFEVQFFFSP